jgi:hydroxypyruvate reductase
LSTLPNGTVLLGGGETTVVLAPGHGHGGRCQELALAAALELPPDAVLLAAGTDGTDGPTDAAGAVVDGGTCRRMALAGFHPVTQLARHDAYPALAAAGDLLITGPTCTNVMDVVIGMRGR